MAEKLAGTCTVPKGVSLPDSSRGFVPCVVKPRAGVRHGHGDAVDAHGELHLEGTDQDHDGLGHSGPLVVGLRSREEQEGHPSRSTTRYNSRLGSA